MADTPRSRLSNKEAVYPAILCLPSQNNMTVGSGDHETKRRVTAPPHGHLRLPLRPQSLSLAVVSGGGGLRCHVIGCRFCDVTIVDDKVYSPSQSAHLFSVVFRSSIQVKFDSTSLRLNMAVKMFLITGLYWTMGIINCTK